MGTAGNLLTPEAIGAGIAGLITVGLIVRAFVKGWIEAKLQATQIGTNTAAMVSAVSIGWERDQRELIVQTLVRIAAALEKLADNERRELNDNIAELLERLKDTPEPRKR